MAADGHRNSTFDNRVTRRPDFEPDVPQRSTAAAITCDDGGEIGG